MAFLLLWHNLRFLTLTVLSSKILSMVMMRNGTIALAESLPE